MSKIKILTERLNDLTAATGVFEGALTFVRMNADRKICGDDKCLHEIMVLLGREAQRTAAESEQVELLAMEIDEAVNS